MTAPDGPLVTTVIPTFRRPALVRRAVLSALGQTMGSLRVCVYDNASEDDTPGVVADLARRDPRVTYYRHAANVGSIANMNFALTRVTTPYFSLLSDDDVLLPTFYQATLAVLERHPDAAFAAGQVIEMKDDGRVQKVVPHLSASEVVYSVPDGLISLVTGDHPTLTGILFRRWVIAEHMPFDPAVAFCDLDLYVRIAARHAFVACAQPCGIFIDHGGSFTHRLAVGDLWREHAKIVDRLERNPHLTEDVRRAAVAKMHAYLEGAVFRMGLRAAAQARFESAETARSILAERPGQAARARLLARVIAIARRSSIARRLGAAAYGGARALSRARSSARLQRRYGRFARALDVASAT